MNEDVSVEETRNSSGWDFKVAVSDKKGQSVHHVTLTREDFDRIRKYKDTNPEMLVKKSFEWLLEQEPKESILPRFELPVIAKYFPDYFDAIQKRL